MIYFFHEAILKVSHVLSGLLMEWDCIGAHVLLYNARRVEEDSLVKCVLEYLTPWSL